MGKEIKRGRSKMQEKKKEEKE